MLTPKEGVLEKCREAPWRQGVLGSTGAQEEVWRPVRYGGSGRRAECQPELGVQPCPCDSASLPAAVVLKPSTRVGLVGGSEAQRW